MHACVSVCVAAPSADRSTLHGVYVGQQNHPWEVPPILKVLWKNIRYNGVKECATLLHIIISTTIRSNLPHPHLDSRLEILCDRYITTLATLHHSRGLRPKVLNIIVERNVNVKAVGCPPRVHLHQPLQTRAPLLFPHF